MKQLGMMAHLYGALSRILAAPPEATASDWIAVWVGGGQGKPPNLGSPRSSLV
jgi:hypothetical protein